MLKTGLRWSAAALLAMAVITVYTVMAIPPGETVPIHFNAKGEPDGWGGRGAVFLALGILVGSSALVAGLMAAVTGTVRKAASEVDEAAARVMERTFVSVWIGTMVLLALVTGWMAASFLGGALVAERLLFVVPPLMAIWLGNILPKTVPNTVVGIKTPPALADPDVWSRTHRRTGRWLVVAGAAGLVATLFAPLLWAIVLGSAALFVPLIAGAIYSYRA